MSSPAPTVRPLGFAALCVAIVCFSLGSTIVQKAGIPGPTMAFWRMIMTSVLWALILRTTEQRFPSREDLRKAIVPGMLFGLNITAFFTGVTKTSVANAEFIGSLTPLILVPAGALLFGERIDKRALSFGLVSLAGLAVVLFNAPPNGVATWGGNLTVLGAMVLWASYLLTSRRLRSTMSVQAIMASITPIAAITIFPITLLSGDLDEVTRHSIPYMVLLAVMTGTLAHGLIVFAQHSVPVGTIGLMQVAQPALAVLWAFLLLDQSIRPIQLAGMALVITGLVAVITVTRRSAPSVTEAAPLPVEG